MAAGPARWQARHAFLAPPALPLVVGGGKGRLTAPSTEPELRCNLRSLVFSRTGDSEAWKARPALSPANIRVTGILPVKNDSGARISEADSDQ